MKTIFNAMAIAGVAIAGLFLIYMLISIHVDVIGRAMAGDSQGLIGLAIFGAIDMLGIGLIGSAVMESW